MFWTCKGNGEVDEIQSGCSPRTGPGTSNWLREGPSQLASRLHILRKAAYKYTNRRSTKTIP